MFDEAKKEMNAYYRKMDFKENMQLNDEKLQEKITDRCNLIYNEMDAFYNENRDISIVLLKSRLHTLMAKYCDPVIFKYNPFFFEIGYNESHSWGFSEITPSLWLQRTKRTEILKQHPWLKDLDNQFAPLYDREKLNMCCIYCSFDFDHNTLGYTSLFRLGVKGIIEQAENSRKTFKQNTVQYDFCTAVIESCTALIDIAHKFRKKAEMLLEKCTLDSQKNCYKMIIQTSAKIPENPPETFFEGLSMLIFTREATGVLENIGISQLGHVDRLLNDLYKKDIREGIITEKEAREWVATWMLHTDIKFDLENNKWPETSTCIELGGCDISGKAIYNDVTKIFIEEHYKHKLINPKLNCRYSKSSPDDYLKTIGNAVLNSHNNFALINDDIIIKGLTDNGVDIHDARMYVNGGCQEVMIEGFGHTEGAGLYVSLPRILDVFLHPDTGTEFLKSIKQAECFEDFYGQFIDTARQFLSVIIDQRNYRQSFYKNSSCCPLYSATQEGCITNGKDYVQGGAKYNFTTVAVVGLANVADSLYSIKKLVYDKKRVSLSELTSALKKNWIGYEDLKREALSIPKYGHNNKNADLNAAQLLNDIGSIIRANRNERGGTYIPSLFIYNYNRVFARHLRATPDGRANEEYLAAGCSPSQLQEIKDITAPIKSMQNIDFSICGGGISVLDMMLPATKKFTNDIFVSFIRACNEYGCVAIQPNVVSVDDLIDAKAHPEKHKNLVVRICGLSAYFISLNPEVQDEIISRNFYEGIGD